MRKPSRTMPPSPSSSVTTDGGWLMFLCVAAVSGAVSYFLPFVLVPLGVFAVVNAVMTSYENDRLARLAADRQGESICTFARSFDYRAIDTWVIRAVFEELQPFCRFDARTLPLRPTDDIYDDLRIDPEDADDLVEVMAFRTGRSFEDQDCARNPFFGKVQTVSDLVMFLVNQPKKQTT